MNELVVKLADFGLAKYVGSFDPQEPPIQNQTGAGTPLYMAPEIKLSSKYTSSVDIFCLGVILLELIMPI